MAAAALCAWALSLASEGLAAGGNLYLGSFARAKRELARIYAAHPTTLYSGCPWEPQKMRLIGRDCAYRARRPEGRGGRIEWEHVVPAHAFGGGRPAWREGHPRCRRASGATYRGRACARRVDPLFQRLEADMHNLFPEIGEINQARGHQAMAEVSGHVPGLGGGALRCAAGACEPPAAVKGDIARAYLYVDAAYPEVGLLTPTARQMFARWSASDPPDAWECRRHAEVALAQGNINSFVVAGCPPRAP